MKKLQKKWPLALTAVVLLAGYGLYHWSQSPASSNAGLQSQNASDVLGDAVQLVPFDETYFSTQLPQNLHAKSIVETTGRPIIASYLLLGSDVTTNGDEVAITIGKLGNSSLGEISAVKVRSEQTDTYAPVASSNLPSGSFTFQKSDHTERAIFWQHGSDYVAIVATTTASRYSEQQDVLGDITMHWQWPGQPAGMLQ